MKWRMSSDPVGLQDFEDYGCMGEAQLHAKGLQTLPMETMTNSTGWDTFQELSPSTIRGGTGGLR